MSLLASIPAAFLIACAAVPAEDIPANDPEPSVPDLPAPPTCLAAADGAGSPLGLPADVALGGFRVRLASAGFSIRHQTSGDRVVFASATRGPLEAARAELDIEDRQGSFSVGEQVATNCTLARATTATSVAGAVVLHGRFDDADPACAALQWQLALCEARPGHLAFRVSTDDASFDRLTLRMASTRDERIWGAGEQFPHDRLSLKGRDIPVIAQEGGVGRGHLPITPAVDLASPGSGGHEGATYYAAPHIVTSELRSVFLEDSAYAELDLRADEVTAIRLWAASMTGRILAGRDPLELIERFTEYAGRMPAPPAWLDTGAIIGLARDLPDARRIVGDLRARGVAIAGVWNQTWSGKQRTFIGEQVLWNWVKNPTYHPDWDAFVADLASSGIRTLCYVNPMLVDPPAEAAVTRDLFDEAMAAGYFVRKADGSPYLLRVTAFDVGLLDLTSEAARLWMKAVIQDELLDRAACSGWMADFGEALPFDAVLASGVDAGVFHTQYPVEWARLNREAIEEAGRLGDILVFNRSGGTRTPTHSLLLWEGDQLTTWDRYDGFTSALHGLIGGGFSGIALNHSDTGGYTSLSAGGVGYVRERELLQRWAEMNAFTAVLRTHEGNQPGANAQIYSDAELMDHFSRMSRVYRALAPYRRTLFAEAAARGVPVVRHLWMHYPDDPIARDVDDEFLLGREVLVAPVKNKCFTPPFCPYDKRVYLPRGEWVHLWTGRVHGTTSAGTYTDVTAPLGAPAVFYRRGAAMAPTLVARLRAEGIAVPDAR